MAPRALKLGTRRSALARAQAGAIARDLMLRHPELRVELVGIDTRGDRVIDRPLASVQGKEFFSAEIDTALERGEVDLTVHSFKDLSLDRSERFRLAAVPRRRSPNDVAVFAPDVLGRIEAGETIVVGSSSPRRASFVPELLGSLLPQVGPVQVRLVDLRGNVDTRLRRLREPRGSERQLDAVVLAFAGIARLWADAEARTLLAPLIGQLPRMVLPLSECPAAPAQGALAVECRRDDAATAALLASLDDAPTRQAAEAERAMLAERGGGCQQRFGASQRLVSGLGSLLYWREAPERDGRVALEPARMRWTPEVPLTAPVGPVRSWDGSRAASLPARPLPEAARQLQQALPACPALFVAHTRALPATAEAWIGAHTHVWVPGVASWRALARRGVWVEGCTDGLGFAAARELMSDEWLGLPEPAGWTVLTHAAAMSGWALEGAPRVLATYEHALDSSAAAAGPPSDSTHVYWASAAQFEQFRQHLGSAVVHASGPGRTYAHLVRAGVQNLRMFPDAQRWREWLAS